MISLRRLRAALLLCLAATGCGSLGTTIVGTWTDSVIDPKGGETANITYIFNADGTKVETVAIPSQTTVSMTTSYTAQNGVLQERFISGTINGRPVPPQIQGLPIKENYTLDGDTLTISQPGKDTLTLHRSS